MKDGKGFYGIPGFLLGFPTFIGAWVYCINEHGFLIGVGFGWFTSLITGVIVGALWPLVLYAAYELWLHLGRPELAEIWELILDILL